MVDHRALLDDIVGGMNSGDYGFYDRQFTEDFIDEYPQSGEVLRGRENARWVLENYPRVNERERPVDQTVLRTQANDAYRIVAPTYTMIKLEGRGNEGTAAVRARYPDGSMWWIVILYQLRGERICRATTFFAPEFAAPEWRAGHVERAPNRN